MGEGKKNARRRRAWIVFQDETGFSERPPVRQTWAPKGKTPVLIHPFNWKNMSVSGAIAYRWDGRRSEFIFQTLAGTYDTESLIAFLIQLRRQMPRRRVILIWDGLPGHRSDEMLEFVAKQRHWLEVEPLPGYTPDLNPVEDIWNQLKSHRLANVCPRNFRDLSKRITAAIKTLYPRRDLAMAALRHVGLFL